MPVVVLRNLDTEENAAGIELVGGNGRWEETGGGMKEGLFFPLDV